MVKLCRQIIDFIYKWLWYAPYYVLYAKPLLNGRLKLVRPSKNCVYCNFTCDLGYYGKKGHNFLLVEIPAENRWFFWRRKFAISDDLDNWYLLPSFTPRRTDKDGRQRYGLNHEVVLRFMNQTDQVSHPIYFTTWK